MERGDIARPSGWRGWLWIRLDPKDHTAYSNRGIAWRAKGDNDRAIADHSEAIRLDPKDAKAYFNRGVVWRAKGDNDRAVADYSEAIRLDPKAHMAYNNRGSIWWAKGDNDRAIADYSEEIRLDPKNAGAWSKRCWARAATGRELPQALADCDESLQLRANDASTIGSLGFVYLRLDRLNEAIAEYDAALKLNPKLAGSLYGRGIAKQRKGDAAGGDADLAAATAIDAGIADRFARYGVK